MAYDYTGTTGNDPVDHGGDTTAKSWNYSQGGADVLIGGSGADTFFMGGGYWRLPIDLYTLTDDTIDGRGGDNTLELAGKYDTYTTTTFNPTGPPTTTPHTGWLLIGNNRLLNVGRLKLDEGSGFGYNIKLDATVFTTGGSIDASALTSARVAIDAAAVTNTMFFLAGAGIYNFTGGKGANSFDLRRGVGPGDFVVGNAAAFNNSVTVDLINGGGILNLPSSQFVNIDEFILAGSRAYTVKVADGYLTGGKELRIYGQGAGAAATSISFDGSAAHDARFTVYGTNGNDVFTGGSGNDAFSGQGGSDTVSGGGGDDYLSTGGDATSTRMDGGDGNDILSIDSGNAFVDAGAGDDWIQVTYNGTQTLRIDCGVGNDKVTFMLPQDQLVTIDPTQLQNVESIVLSGYSVGPDRKYSLKLADGILTAGQIMQIGVTGVIDIFTQQTQFNFDGSAETHGSFVFTPPQHAIGLTWSGGSGDDLFIVGTPMNYGGTFNRYLGGGGTNTIDYSGGGPVRISMVGGGVVFGSDQSADIIGLFQHFILGSGDNQFTGADLPEQIFVSKPGEETFTMAGGDDFINLGSTLDAFDLIDGGAGNDRVLLSGTDPAGVVFKATTMTNVETLQLLNGNYSMTTHDATVAAGQTLTVEGSQLEVPNKLIFNGSAETDGSFIITGGAGADQLTGGAGADVIFGGGGPDVIDGGAGQDWLIDSYGGGTLRGGDGHDSVWGGAGADLLEGGPGDDTIVGNGGIDTVTYANATARVEVDLSWIEDQNTRGAGVDTLVGIENLIGSAFDDRLSGSGVANVLTGGAGADVFVFKTALGGGNIDTISDFAVGSDTIELSSAIFTAIAPGALSASAFAVGSAAGDASDRIIYNSATGALSYDADGSGAGAAVPFAILQGAPALSAGDFVIA